METKYQMLPLKVCKVCSYVDKCMEVWKRKPNAKCLTKKELQELIDKYAELEKALELEKNKAETNYRALKLACINVAMREAISSTGSLEGLDKMTESVMKDYIGTATEELAKENNSETTNT